MKFSEIIVKLLEEREISFPGDIIALKRHLSQSQFPKTPKDVFVIDKICASSCSRLKTLLKIDIEKLWENWEKIGKQANVRPSLKH